MCNKGKRNASYLKTVDVAQEAVARYIAEQQGKKDVFEYSIFGNPNVKIGNFTQSKLEGLN